MTKAGFSDPADPDDNRMVEEGAMTSVQYYNEGVQSKDTKKEAKQSFPKSQQKLHQNLRNHYLKIIMTHQLNKKMQKDFRMNKQNRDPIGDHGFFISYLHAHQRDDCFGHLSLEAFLSLLCLIHLFSASDP
jgi:hypothetical protein